MADKESSLSNWAGPYVTEMLGKGAAAAALPYTAFTGPLTAGASPLENAAFTGLAGLSAPTNMGAYTPQSFTGAGYANNTYNGPAGSGPNGNPYSQNATTGMYSSASGLAFPGSKGMTAEEFSVLSGGAGQAGQQPQSTMQQYMTPYLQGALQPQYDAANRQSQIQQQAMQSQYGKAGAYGGSRQAVAGAELDRGLLDRMAGITGTGYQNAFEQAQKQFNTEQDRSRDAQTDANKYGFDVLKAQGDAGGLQRAIDSQGIAADIAQFELERDYDKNNVLFTQSLLDGLPLETQTYNYTQPSGLANLAGGIAGGKSILDLIAGNENTATAAAQVAIPTNRMTEFNVYVSANTAKGMTQADAESAARTTMGLG